MGGEIGVRSAVGEGSTFHFTLKAARAEAPDAHDEEPVPSPARFDASVLLVEDDRIARFVVEKLLGDFGCRVEVATDGGQAVAAVTAGEYDLVFMDCQMPVMDGYEATARIRQVEGSTRHTPIVAMTATVMQGQGERCSTAGMDDYLGKPLDPARLQAILTRWLPPGAHRE